MIERVAMPRGLWAFERRGSASRRGEEMMAELHRSIWCEQSSEIGPQIGRRVQCLCRAHRAKRSKSGAVNFDILTSDSSYAPVQ
jgi:hypothetical protein